jgi:hypothetical protein
MAAAQRSAAQQRLVALLGPATEEYLRRLADTDRSLTRQLLRHRTDDPDSKSPSPVENLPSLGWTPKGYAAERSSRDRVNAVCCRVVIEPLLFAECSV